MTDRHSGRDHVADAAPTLDRIGGALDRIGRAGWPAVHAALAGYVRERRGRLARAGRLDELPFDVARDLIDLAGEAEALATLVEAGPGLVSRESIVDALRDAHRNDSAADAVEYVSSLVGWSADDDPEMLAELGDGDAR